MTWQRDPALRVIASPQGVAIQGREGLFHPICHGIKTSMGNYWAYLLANTRNGTLYAGVTSRLKYRVWEHKQKLHPGFTARYGIDQLVWCERFDTAEAAIRQEKKLKRSSRRRKNRADRSKKSILEGFVR
jgi:putative endonuclease